MTDYRVESDGEFVDDPSDRVWRCPACGVGYVVGVELVTAHYIGRAMACTNPGCRYWERVIQ